MIRLALCMALPKRKLVAKPDDEELLINGQCIRYLPRVMISCLACKWRYALSKRLRTEPQSNCKWKYAWGRWACGGGASV